MSARRRRSDRQNPSKKTPTMGLSPSKVLPGLIQGGADVLENEDFFKNEKITHVVIINKEWY